VTGHIVDTADGFAVTLPQGWYRLGLSPAEYKKAVDAGLKDTTALRLFLRASGSTFFNSVKFYALDGDGLVPDSGFFGSLNVLAMPHSDLTLDALEKLNVSRITSSDVVKGKVSSEQVRLGTRDAIRLQYKIAVTGSAGREVEVGVEQYIVPTPKSQFLLTVTGPDATLHDAQAVAKSFEVLEH